MLMVPAGSGEVVVKASVLTTMLSGPEVLDAPVASVTIMVNVEFPAAVALPVIFTVSVVLGAKERPAGKLPDAMAQVSGGTPPVAITGWL
jgi:hypothetical protein